MSNKELPIEEEEQKWLVEWLKLRNIMFFSIPNENKLSGIIRSSLIGLLGKVKGLKLASRIISSIESKLRSMGKVKGVSDIIVMLPNKILFIELKRRKKVLRNGSFSISHTQVSKEQYDFLTKVSKFDYAESALCYGWHEAKEFIESHL